MHGNTLICDEITKEQLETFKSWYTPYFNAMLSPLLEKYGTEIIGLIEESILKSNSSNRSKEELINALFLFYTRTAKEDIPSEISSDERLYKIYVQPDNWVLTIKIQIAKALINHFGKDILEDIKVIELDMARGYWSHIAREYGNNSIESLIKILWTPDRFQYTAEHKNDGIEMNCKKCYLHDLAKAIGATDLMYIFACNTDPGIVEGFNPNMGFKRDKTLMEGNDCCNHHYFMKA